VWKSDAIGAVGERIIVDDKYYEQQNVVDKFVSHLEIIADSAISSLPKTRDIFVRVLVLIDKLALVNDTIDPPEALIRICVKAGKLKNPSLLSIITGTSAPLIVIGAIVKLADGENSYVVPALQSALVRGCQQGLDSELSGSLLRLRHVRGKDPMDNAETGSSHSPEHDEAGLIWGRMFDGTAAIIK